MTQAVAMAEVWRGPFLESVHLGHAVVCDAGGEIVQAWGDPDQLVLPRSSSKMIQALPLIESGAAARFGLGPAHLALACASHEGAEIHVSRVQSWLAALGLGPEDLRCGVQPPRDLAERDRLIKTDASPCQIHNNCSGKHAGFLTFNAQIGGDPEYLDLDHPVQKAALDAWERSTGETVAGHAIDGCSAPNFATSLLGMGRAMARFAAADAQSPEGQLREAMARHPDLVAGEGRACTILMRALGGGAAVKTGAEAFFVAILPEQKLGIALKIVDGATRASECALAAILVKLGVLAADHPGARAFVNAPISNWRGTQTGWLRPAPALC